MKGAKIAVDFDSGQEKMNNFLKHPEKEKP
jgi:hypothetical protein